MENKVTKILVLLVVALVIGIGGTELWQHRHYEEEMVAGPGVTEVKKLSDWFPDFEGTMMDSSVFILEGEEPGGTALFFGGTHPCEIAGVMAALIIIENAEVSAGKLIVIPHANRSGSTGTMPSAGWVLYYEMNDENGNPRKFRMGDRNTHPLDSWPDPDIFVHYPSGQQLSYVESRNLNRCFPGRADGFVTEKVGYAIAEIIRQENVNIAFDMHEAELLYPVTNCIVAPTFNASFVYASWASLELGVKFDIHVEPSPMSYRGFSHRELGDSESGAYASVGIDKTLYTFLLEAPEPYLDQPTGPKTMELLLDGKDEYLDYLSKRDKLYVDYNKEDGKDMDLRVGRHIETTFAIFNEYTFGNEGDPEVMLQTQIRYTCPAYDEIMANGLGAYLKDPNENSGRVYSDLAGRLIR